MWIQPGRGSEVLLEEGGASSSAEGDVSSSDVVLSSVVASEASAIESTPPSALSPLSSSPDEDVIAERNLPGAGCLREVTERRADAAAFDDDGHRRNADVASNMMAFANM